MTCASCVARIERKLNKLDGRRGLGELRDRAGDRALRAERDRRRARRASSRRPATARGPLAAGEQRHEEPGARSRGGSPCAVALTVPLALLAMVPPLQFSGWEWVALALATPVVFWSGSGVPPRSAPERAPPRGDDGHAHLDRARSRRGRGRRSCSSAALEEDTYFEVAAVITTLILLGRYLEARAKRRSGDAIRKLLELGAKEARVLRDGDEVAVPIEEVVRRGPLRRPAGREDRDRRRGRRGRSRRSTSRC